MTDFIFTPVAPAGTDLAVAASSIVLNDLLPVLSFVLPICTVALFVYVFVRTRETKVRGPAVSGTAQVLSVRKIGWAVGNAPSQRSACRIGLRVEIPGREPYEVTVRQNFEPWVLGTAVVPGRSVPVQAEEANPQNVRIDLSRPIPPSRRVVNLPPKVTFNQSSWSPQSGWSGSPPPADIADQIKAAIDTAFNQSQGAGPVIQQPNLAAQAGMYPQNLGNAVLSAAALLATGQRVPALLKSFAPMGTTPRSLGRTPSRPELIDAPHYMLEVELNIPSSGPITGRAIQPVPVYECPISLSGAN